MNNTVCRVILTGVALLLIHQGLQVDSQMDFHSDAILGNITVRQGETVFLRCPQDKSVIRTAWLNKSVLLYTGESKWTMDPRVSLELLSDEEFVVRIDNVSEYEEGLYVCLAQTLHRLQRILVHIIVHVPSKIMYLTDDVMAIEGTNVSLECIASGNPEPTVTWRRLSPTAYMLHSKDGSLEFMAVSRHRAGTYECSANNEVSTVAKTMELKVNYPPTVLEVKDVGVPLGQQAELGCKAEAEPAAEFEWYKDNERVLNGSYDTEIESLNRVSKLVFFNVSEENYGNYSCVAINKLGIANASLALYASPWLKVLQDQNAGTVTEHPFANLLAIFILQVFLRF